MNKDVTTRRNLDGARGGIANRSFAEISFCSVAVASRLKMVSHDNSAFAVALANPLTSKIVEIATIETMIERTCKRG